MIEHAPPRAGIDGYSQRALARVWKAVRFSWWFTGLTHRFPQADAIDRRIQFAELAYIRGSRLAQAGIAENYVGLPLTPPVEPQPRQRNPPFRMPLRSTRGQSRLGSGRAICKRITVTHGGALWAENRAAGGATFRFTVSAATGVEDRVNGDA